MNPDVEGRKILKGKQNKLNERKWAGLIWLGAGSNCVVLLTWSDGTQRPLAQNYAKCDIKPKNIDLNREDTKALKCPRSLTMTSH
jgi:hypothetical protein